MRESQQQDPARREIVAHPFQRQGGIGHVLDDIETHHHVHTARCDGKALQIPLHAQAGERIAHQLAMRDVERDELRPLGQHEITNTAGAGFQHSPDTSGRALKYRLQSCVHFIEGSLRYLVARQLWWSVINHYAGQFGPRRATLTQLSNYLSFGT